jgi:uncharacterized protein
MLRNPASLPRQDVILHSRARIVCVGGLSGTGKSLLARSLAPGLLPSPGALLFRTDVERKALFGVGDTDHLPPQAYRPEVSARVYGDLTERALRVARAGHSVIIDAVFAKPDERAAIERATMDTSIAFCGLFLTAGLHTRLARISSRQPDASDANADVVRLQEEFKLGTVDWNIIDASDSAEETLARGRAALDHCL